MFKWLKKRKSLRQFHKECPGSKTMNPCSLCSYFVKDETAKTIGDDKSYCKLAKKLGLE